jgi:hypothetical protein
MWDVFINEQFKSVFTTESIDNIPNKGVSPHPDIPPLTISLCMCTVGMIYQQANR